MSPILPAPGIKNTNVSQEESGNLQLICIDQKCEELCLVPREDREAGLCKKNVKAKRRTFLPASKDFVS
ncbi:hypothetical protein CapIbe_021697 [Capra ibex]